MDNKILPLKMYNYREDLVLKSKAKVFQEVRKELEILFDHVLEELDMHGVTDSTKDLSYNYEIDGGPLLFSLHMDESLTPVLTNHIVNEDRDICPKVFVLDKWCGEVPLVRFLESVFNSPEFMVIYTRFISCSELE